jgi:hypothetical protein
MMPTCSAAFWSAKIHDARFNCAPRPLRIIESPALKDALLDRIERSIAALVALDRTMGADPTTHWLRAQLSIFPRHRQRVAIPSRVNAPAPQFAENTDSSEGQPTTLSRLHSRQALASGSSGQKMQLRGQHRTQRSQGSFTLVPAT